MPGVKKIPFILVTGFLGAGKTTFIKRILENLSDGIKIGIIQNEYASANIDTDELKSTGRKFEVLEINGGSVFCICLLANFIDSLASFIDTYLPDMIILEASGLSDPIGIAELMQHDKLKEKIYLSGTWCIIDALNYPKTLKVMDRLSRQLMISDIVIINKTDIGYHNVSGIRQEVIKNNSAARILESTFCKIGQDNLNKIIGSTESLIGEGFAKLRPYGRADISTVVLKTSRPVSKAGLNQFITEVENRVIRMKGFVIIDDGSKVSLQSVSGNSTVEDVPWYNGPTELIGLGYDITSAEFGRKFHEIRQFCTFKD
jgi:G3E family GTPase